MTITRNLVPITSHCSNTHNSLEFPSITHHAFASSYSAIRVPRAGNIVLGKVSFFYTAYFLVCEANNKQIYTISRVSKVRKGQCQEGWAGEQHLGQALSEEIIPRSVGRESSEKQLKPWGKSELGTYEDHQKASVIIRARQDQQMWFQAVSKDQLLQDF